MRIKIYLLLLPLLILLIQCEDEAAGLSEQNDSSPLSTSSALDTLFDGKSVYICGFYSDTVETTPIACYWKDGARIDLDYGWAEDIKVV
ncbi:MAG: hypothetical protein VX744_01670, partial [Candidatus Neomarinimicrobiota bacterium]|nr:hypothetical protein [Candidatus Neomarinimicrobiota bacterium]